MYGARRALQRGPAAVLCCATWPCPATRGEVNDHLYDILQYYATNIVQCDCVGYCVYMDVSILAKQMA